MSTSNSPTWVAGFKSDYDKLFVKKWSSYLGAVLLVLVIVGLMVNGMVWGVFGGVKFWGDWFNNFIGLGPLLGLPRELNSVWLHSMSLMNITLVPGLISAQRCASSIPSISGMTMSDSSKSKRWRSSRGSAAVPRSTAATSKPAFSSARVR